MILAPWQYSEMIARCFNFSWFNGFVKQKPRKIVILFLGLDRAGKTTIIANLIGKQSLEQPKPTVGFAKPRRLVSLRVPDQAQRKVFRKEEVFLHELGGAERFRKAWQPRARSAHGVIFTIDETDEDRRAEASAEACSLKQVCDAMGKPFVILLTRTQRVMEPSISIAAYASEINLPPSLIFLENQKEAALWHVLTAVTNNFEALKKTTPDRHQKRNIKSSTVVPEDLTPCATISEAPCQPDVVRCKNKTQIDGKRVLCGNPATIRCAATSWLPFCEDCYRQGNKQLQQAG